MTPKVFIKQYLPYAQETEKKTGISAIFTLAQAALESAWGEKAPGNMFFGVKAKASDPEWKRQLLTTTEYLDSPNVKFPKILSVEMQASGKNKGKYKYRVQDWFRKYDTPEECFTDHAKLFIGLKRYAEAMKYAGDPYRFAEEIAKAGYATASTYADDLKAVCRTVERNMP